MIPKIYKETILRLYELPNLGCVENKKDVKIIKEEWENIRRFEDIPLKDI